MQAAQASGDALGELVQEQKAVLRLLTATARALTAPHGLQISPLRGLDEIRAAVDELAHDCVHEQLSISTRRPSLDAMRRGLALDQASLARGVLLREVLASTTVDERYLAALRELQGTGASEVRLTESGLVPLIVVDRRVAVVSTSTGPDRSAIRIEEPALVQLVVDHAERVWNAATPVFSPQPRNVALSPRQHQVLAHLRAGLSDHGIARALRVSERTVRTDVAGIMQVLGARSRWQAGYLAAVADRGRAVRARVSADHALGTPAPRGAGS